ncbi:HEPN domain-containing protein [Rhizobium leguminosarum]|uniref:HEPN domain-containing protein n=1 Tax=Rhizobium leguminosarum TaxID=384 RepID=UPI003F9AE518
MREVQEVLAHLKRIEAAPGKPEAAEVRLLRGLFYVHLYGAFEYGINRIVQSASEHIDGEAIPHRDLISSIGVIVLNAQFNAVGQSSTQNQWSKRLALIERRHSNEVASIGDGMIDFQNVWLKTLEQIFLVFGISKPAMYDVTKSGYVLELTDTRNKIAHGRESPQEIGMKRRSAELQLLYDAISLQIFYFLDCFNEYLAGKEYMANAV